MEEMRIQIDFARSRVAELDELAERCGLKTRKDLINNALTLFEWAVEEVSKGRVVASVDEKEEKYREVTLPALRTAARHAARRAYQIVEPEEAAVERSNASQRSAESSSDY
jgi:hypothetical protein